MKAAPRPGDSYRQEYYLGEAEDMAVVIARDVSVAVPAGTYDACLQTREWTPLEPGSEEHKFYAPGIGTVLERAVDGSIRSELAVISTGG